MKGGRSMKECRVGTLDVGRFLILSPCLDEETMEAIRNAPKPDTVAGVPVPDSLDIVKVGQFIELTEMRTDYELLHVPCRELLRMSDAEIAQAKVYEVYGFSSWCVREVGRIAGLFAQCRVEPTAEEVQAGIGRMDYGWPGLADYYARRMGIHDPDYVLKRVGILKLWLALKIDADGRKYERRLAEIMNAKMRRA